MLTKKKKGMICMATIIEEKDFKNEISSGVTLVDFYADWCGPCKMLAPIIDDFSQETDIKVVKLNVDESQNVAMEYGIMSIPTLIIFKDGEVATKHVGFATKEQLHGLVDSAK